MCAGWRAGYPRSASRRPLLDASSQSWNSSSQQRCALIGICVQATPEMPSHDCIIMHQVLPSMFTTSSESLNLLGFLLSSGHI